MNDLEKLQRHETECRMGIREIPKVSTSSWFAWRPVRLGTFGIGPIRWLVQLNKFEVLGIVSYGDKE